MELLEDRKHLEELSIGAADVVEGVQSPEISERTANALVGGSGYLLEEVADEVELDV